jgi:hypothetical protein
VSHSRFLAVESFRERSCEFGVSCWPEVGVHLPWCGRVGPAATAGDGLDVCTATKTLGGHPVVEVMKADPIQLELLAKSGESLGGAVWMPREFADRVTGEDVGAVGQLGAGGARGFEGSPAVSPEQLDCGRIERDRPPSLRLGLLLDRASWHIAERTSPADGRGVEVDVGPAQSTQLASAGAGEGA